MWLFGLLVTKVIKINLKIRRLYSCICNSHKHSYWKQEIHFDCKIAFLTSASDVRFRLNVTGEQLATLMTDAP